MVKTRLLLLLSGLIILSSSKCDFRPPPERELCGAYEDRNYELACNDPRLDVPDYFRNIKKGDICATAKSYSDMRSYCEGLRVDLKKCKRKRK